MSVIDFIAHNLPLVMFSSVMLMLLLGVEEHGH